MSTAEPKDIVAGHARILVADDEESIRFLIGEVMTREGYEVDLVEDGGKAIQRIREREYDLVIMDVKMPGVGGLEALSEVRRLRPNLIVVMITAFGTQQIALEAIRKGAYDYFSKPFEIDEMRIVVRRALEKQQLLRQISNLENRLVERLSFDRIIGTSHAMREVYNLIERVITNDVTVLITGESGTGKELVAQAIHYHSARRSKPFVSVNCAAIPEPLLESEMFGHEKGAFTGAVGLKAGRFEAANGGSIFLDEIGDMPLGLQSKLLRVLQEREFTRVGGNKPVRVDIRVIAATNQDLAKSVANRSFREDLFFRLNVLPIQLPPLRKRHEDMPLLVEHFIGVYNPRLNRNIHGVTPAAMELIERYAWPGNVRELENVVQRAMILAPGALITAEDLPPNLRNAPPPGAAASAVAEAAIQGGVGVAMEMVQDFSVPLQQKIEMLSEEMEKKIIAAALAKAGNRRQDTADLLGISRKSLHNKMVKYQMFESRGASDDTEF